mgnify:CR=1 FL=1
MRRILFFLLFPAFSYAQDTNALNEVVVSDNRIETSVMESGRNVQVLTKKQIEALPVQNLNDLLQHVSGVDFRQRGAWGAQADVSLRGGTFDQTLILVNGIKVSDPQTGHHAMNLGIELSSIKQIEVIKGPAASRYGLNSFSGVINIITEPTSDDQVSVSASTGQAYDSQLPNEFYGGYDARTTVHVGSKKSRHLLSGSRTQSTGYRPNTDLNRNTVMYQSITESSIGTFNVMGSFVSNDFGASGFYAFPIDSSSEEQVTTFLTAVQHTLKKGAFRLHSKVYSRKNFDTYTLFRERPEVFQNVHRTDVEGAEVHGTYTYKVGTVGLGTEYRREAINSSNLGLWTRDNIGVFVENRLWLMKERLALNTGAYINVSSDFGTQILPSIELNYKINQRLALFGNAGQSFRVPTFTDLYYVGPTNVGNGDLKPESSTNYEVGVKAKEGAHFIQVSGFYQDASDLIDWVRDSVSQPWQPQNYESVATTGLEFNYELRAQQSIGNSLFSWDMARVGYTYLDMQTQSQGESISRYAISNLRNQLTFQTTFSYNNKLSLSLTTRYLDRPVYNSYWLVDARVQYRVSNASFWLDCTNILDTQYIETANALMPGRWFRAGFEIVIK